MSLYGIDLKIFEILVNQNYIKVYQAVYSYTNDKFISEDAIQQAFVIAYTKLDQLKIKDKFASWVISIALNEAKRMLKSKYNDNVIPLTDLYLDKLSDNKENAIDLKEDINNVLSKLKKKETEILVLKYYADLSLQQIANFLGINLSNTKVRLHRAKEKCRNLIIQNQEQSTEEVGVQWHYLKKNLTD